MGISYLYSLDFQLIVLLIFYSNSLFILITCCIVTGHGNTPSAHAAEASKPPPGPRMPDGTRGFAIGRGRPPVPASN